MLESLRFSLLRTSHNILNNKKIKFLCIINYLGSTNGFAKPLTMFRHNFSNDSTNDTSPLLLKAMTLSLGLGVQGYRGTLIVRYVLVVKLETVKIFESLFSMQDKCRFSGKVLKVFVAEYVSLNLIINRLIFACSVGTN